jgi:type I restriction enzyme R subunit
MTTTESQIENQLIEKLKSLKYEYRPDIRDRDALVQNFRQKFETLNRVNLTEAEFDRLLEKIIITDVFAAAKTLRTMNDFTRDENQLNFITQT